jgi:hypothetical protein
VGVYLMWCWARFWFIIKFLGWILVLVHGNIQELNQLKDHGKLPHVMSGWIPRHGKILKWPLVSLYISDFFPVSYIISILSRSISLFFITKFIILSYSPSLLFSVPTSGMRVKSRSIIGHLAYIYSPLKMSLIKVIFLLMKCDISRHVIYGMVDNSIFNPCVEELPIKRILRL